MNEFLAWLSSIGIAIPAPILDGKVHRFGINGGTDNGWYIGWVNRRIKGEGTYTVAQVGDWRTGEVNQFMPSGSLSKEDRAAIKSQMARGSKKVAEEKRAKQSEVALQAEKLWNGFKEDAPLTEYQKRKKIDAHYGARSSGTMLRIPMRDVDGNMWSFQTIYEDGTKRFMKGGRIKGCFHLIGEWPDEGEVFVCEGYSTGVSVHMATRKPVVVAFNSQNLVDCAVAIRKEKVDLTFTIAGDDDKYHKIREDGKTPENAGRTKGDKAARIMRGGVVYPIFSDESGKPTDFNDLHVREGLEAVREQLEVPPQLNAGFTALGYGDGFDYYYNHETCSIVKCTGYSDVQMMKLAPLDYWVSMYPSTNGGIRWTEAKDDLLAMSRKRGPFNSMRLRGIGVWRDRNRTVINTGEQLLVDGRQTPLTGLNSSYYYIRTVDTMRPLHPKPLDIGETRKLLEACQGLSWADSKAGLLLAGWLATARIAGALPVRPHIWLTGGKGCGKSTVMEGIVSPSLGEGKLYVLGGTTEAGIRQTASLDSRPLIFDEFETVAGNHDRVQSILELLRQAWSLSDGQILKGTAHGQAMSYVMSFSALVSSIRVSLDNDADRSRFSILELRPPNSDVWPKVRSLINELSEEYGERLFARSCFMVPTILTSFERLSKTIGAKYGQRFGQQYGMLLAGYWSLTSDDPISAEDAEELSNGIDFNDQVEDEGEDDEMDCLNHLLTHVDRFAEGMYQENRSVGYMLQKAFVNEQYRPALMTYGIRVEKDCVFVANSHKALSRIYQGTRWATWTSQLIRLPGASRSKRYIDGRQMRGIDIPCSLVKQE